MRLVIRCVLAPLFAVVACSQDRPSSGTPSESPAAPEATTKPSEREVKLVELLESATVDSQLGASTLSNEPPAGEPLLAVSFEKPGEIPAVLRSYTTGRVSKRPDKDGSGLRLAPTKGRPVGFVVPAKPGRFYRAQVRVSGARPGWTTAVLESRAKVEGTNRPQDLLKILPKHTQAGSHVNLDVLLARHAISAEETYDWQELDLRIFTRQATRSLVLVFEAPDRGEPLWVDDLRITALEPSYAQRVQWVAEKYDAKHESFGQLLTLPDVRTLERGQEHSYSYRHGILAPSPTTIAWEHSLLPKLSVGLGLLRESPPNSMARFRITVDGKEILNAEVGAGGWKEHTLDLTEWSGKTATLTFEATASQGDPIAVWSNPTLWRPQNSPSEPPPDVYLIAVDTLRADRTSVYGYGRKTTPHLEVFAKDSVVFENAIAASNWTPESFAALFTSKASAEHGVTERSTKLAQNTWATRMREAGYATQGIAYKLLLYDMGFEDGFDAYFNVPLFHLSTSYTVRAEHNWSRAEEWLSRGRGRKQFTFIHFNDPHQPFNHLEPELSQFAKVGAMKARGLQMPILIRTKSVASGPKQKACGPCRTGKTFAPWFLDAASDLYDGEVAYVDRYVNEVLDNLRKTGRYDDSLIIFLSDHGEGLGDHRGYVGHGFSHLFEEQIRVPLIIKPPASAGILPTRVKQPVSLMDVLPTALSLVDLEPPEDIRGRSLVPLMRGEPLEARPAIAENYDTQSVAARSQTHKLILRFTDTQATEWFYDLQKDPKESTSLPLGAGGSERTALRDAIARHVSDTHSGAHLWVEGEVSQPLTLSFDRNGKPAADAHVLVGRVQGNTKQARWRFKPSPGAIALSLLAPELPGGSIQVGTGATHAIPESSAWPTRAVRKEIAPGINLVLRRRPPRGSIRREGVSGDELQALEALGYVEK